MRGLTLATLFLNEETKAAEGFGRDGFRSAGLSSKAKNETRTEKTKSTSAAGTRPYSAATNRGSKRGSINSPAAARIAAPSNGRSNSN
jgi:hypothetical protein